MIFKFRKNYIFFIMISFVFSTASLFALDQEITDKYSPASPPLQQEKVPQKSFYRSGESIEINGFADVQQGYDNNVDLNPRRREDGFLQSMANVEVTYKVGDKVKLKGGGDVFNTTYYNHNNNNLLDISSYIGFDWQIFPELRSRNRFILDHYSYPNRKENTFSGIALSSYLRHFFIKDTYHEIGYEYLKRWYPDRKITLASLSVGDDDRIDSRYRIKYNIGSYHKQFFVKLINELSQNDSNDIYQNYYDYLSYRLKPSIMFFFNDSFYTNLSVIYKHTRYEDRKSTETAGTTVRDNTYILNASFYYDISKNATLSITYSYTENLSNDPYQEYSGSIISSGVSYSF